MTLFLTNLATSYPLSSFNSRVPLRLFLRFAISAFFSVKFSPSPVIASKLLGISRSAEYPFHDGKSIAEIAMLELVIKSLLFIGSLLTWSYDNNLSNAKQDAIYLLLINA